MKLSIIIPAYNEERTLEKIVGKVFAAGLPQGIEREVIIIDDCSKDRTLEIALGLAKKHPIKVLRHKINQGKGVSVRDGLLASTGDFVVIQDADLEYDPREYEILLSPILSDGAEVVYGSRFMGGRPHHVLYFWHSVGNKLLTTLSNMMTNLNLTDMEVCYKMMTRKVVDEIKAKLVSKRFGIEPEITARIKKFVIYEVGISYKGRTYAEGKKIGWKDGFAAIFAIFRFNLFN
jgi:glycosyltransferase involved in cell wall biosynthesis